MDDLTERFRGLDEMAAPDVWADASTREPIDPGVPSLGRRLTVIGFAAVVALAASGFLFVAFRSPLEMGRSVGGADPLHDVSSRIAIEQLPDQGLTATWSHGEVVREGIPVTVVGPGPEPGGSETSSPRPGSISEFLKVNGFSLDSSALGAVSPQPLALPSDTIIDTVGVDDVMLMAFAEEGGVEWGKMTALRAPTDLRLLDVGTRYRIVVVGLGQADSLFQFAFDIDVLAPARDLVAMPDVVGTQIGDAIRDSRSSDSSSPGSRSKTTASSDGRVPTMSSRRTQPGGARLPSAPTSRSP
jgi:hypothetical protein